MNEDITFCNNQKCRFMSCERNPKHIKNHYMYHSFAALEGTEHCLKECEWVKRLPTFDYTGGAKMEEGKDND